MNISMGAAARLPMTVLGEDAWDDLLSFIEERRVIPIIGQLAAHNQGDQRQHVELARTLYAQAVIDPAHRVVLLREAASLLDSLPAPMHGLHSVRLWRERVRDAQGTATAPQARPLPLDDQGPQGEGPPVPLRLVASGGAG